MADVSEATQRMLDALQDADRMFTRDQVLHLVSLAVGTDDPEQMWRAGFDAGYWARVAEENAAYPPERMNLTDSAGTDAVRVYRKRVRIDERYERPDDFKGLGRAAVERLRKEWN